MSSGGARARTGRAPNPASLRQDASTWVHLPVSGRKSAPPPWPLPLSTKRSLALWTSEWMRPQALMWEALGQHLEVALYVQSVIVAEGPKASAADRGLVLRQMDYLGLTVGGLAKNRWLIAPPPEQKVARTDDPARNRAKARLIALEGGAS